MIPVANIEGSEDPKLHRRANDRNTVHSNCIETGSLPERGRFVTAAAHRGLTAADKKRQEQEREQRCATASTLSSASSSPPSRASQSGFRPRRRQDSRRTADRSTVEWAR